MIKEKNALYKFLKIIYTILLKVIFRPKVIGKENIPTEGPIILAGNHKHAVDPTVVMMSTKRIVHFMAKEDLFKGIHGKIFEKMGLIKVSRDKSNPTAVTSAIRVLENKEVIGIFPEGTRNRTDKEILRFRTGTVKIAKKVNALIVPFAIKGKYKVFRKGVTLEFGNPIDISKMEIEEANKYLEEQVLKLIRN